MTSEPKESSVPGRSRSGRPTVMTFQDEGGKLRAGLAKAAALDALRIMDCRPPAFGSLRDVIVHEIERQKAEEAASKET